jgi:hypothetical protein
MRFFICLLGIYPLFWSNVVQAMMKEKPEIQHVSSCASDVEDAASPEAGPASEQALAPIFHQDTQVKFEDLSQQVLSLILSYIAPGFTGMKNQIIKFEDLKPLARLQGINHCFRNFLRSQRIHVTWFPRESLSSGIEKSFPLSTWTLADTIESKELMDGLQQVKSFARVTELSLSGDFQSITDLHALELPLHIEKLYLKGKVFPQPEEDIGSLSYASKIITLKLDCSKLSITDSLDFQHLARLEELHLTKLPGSSLHGLNLPTGLRELYLDRWEEIQSFDGLNLPENLKNLEIYKLNQVQNFDGLTLPTNLSCLFILSLPRVQKFDGLTLPTTLNYLAISSLPRVQSFDGLTLPTNLSCLSISCLSQVQSFGALVLPKNLSKLAISSLPRVQSFEGTYLPRRLKSLCLGGSSDAIFQLSALPSDLESLTVSRLECNLPPLEFDRRKKLHVTLSYEACLQVSEEDFHKNIHVKAIDNNSYIVDTAWNILYLNY